MEYIDRFLSECTLTLEAASLTRCWPSWHEDGHKPAFNRLCYILEGEGRFEVDGEAFYPKAGDMVLLPAGRRQAYGHISSRYYLKYWCHFRAEAYGTRLFDLLCVPYFLHVGKDQELIRLFERMVTCYAAPGGTWALRARGALMDLLAEYLDRSGEDAVFPRKTGAEEIPAEKLRLLGKYISEHLGEDLTLESLAEQVHFHPNYFIAFFKKYFGVSPLRYVSNLRIEKAKSLLKSTSLPIHEIAVRTGYHDLYHFSRRFKEQTGYSPSDFRKT